MSDTLLKTPLHAWHLRRGARMVDFAGWDMPVQYTSITEEHQAVRTACGLFDVSHMGRLRFTGPDAMQLLDSVLTNDCARIAPGRIRYALVCNEAGGVLDDVLVYNLGDGDWQLVVNASNRAKIVDWLRGHRTDFDVVVEDRTSATFMVAVQGPRAVELAEAILDVDVSPMKYYSAASARIDDAELLVSRTGYTGEDGVEITGADADAEVVLDAILAAGESRGLLPAGLGCRDTLRLESAMPLYGHELDESIDPLTAGLDFAVKLEAGDFLGRDALRRIRDEGPRRGRIGLYLEGRRIAREHTPVFAPDGDQPIGEVTSGTFSPTLETSIAMAYVDVHDAEVGTQLEVELRGKRWPATVVALPFHKRA